MKGFIQGCLECAMSKIHTPHMTGFLHWTAPQPVVWYLLEAYLLSWRWQDSPLTIFNYVKVFFCHAHQNSWNRFHAWAQSLQKSLIQVTLFQCIFSFQPPPFPMVWRTLRSSICQPLVSRERKGLGCSSPPSSAGSVLSQEPCRCLVIRHSHLPAWAEGIRVTETPDSPVTTTQCPQSSDYWTPAPVPH